MISSFGKFACKNSKGVLNKKQLLQTFPEIIDIFLDEEIEGDCEVLRLLGNYTYRLKEVIPMSENKRFYIFKFQVHPNS